MSHAGSRGHFSFAIVAIRDATDTRNATTILNQADLAPW